MRKVNLTLQGERQKYDALLDLEKDLINVSEKTFQVNDLKYGVPIDGQVYGVALNFKEEYDQFESQMSEKPYNKPPVAPVLYIKPENTYCSHQFQIAIPEGEKQLRVGATLGIVFGEDATKVKKENINKYIAGYTIVNDISIPHESYYRPAIRERARDHFCAIGPWIVSKEAVNDPNNLNIQVSVNDELQVTANSSNLVRDVETLIEDVTAYMTLRRGDVLLIGVDANMPLVGVGDKVTIEVEGIGVLENEFREDN